jgi:cysteine desulfurase
MKKKLVYFDQAATTAVSPEVFLAMKPFFGEKFGNPSEPHLAGRQGREAIEKAREQTAEFLGAKEEEIIFTSGATEAINLAHKGLVEALKEKSSKPHLITSPTEHKAVLESVKHLEKLNLVEVTYLSVDQNGLVDLESLKKAIKPETLLVSIMFANNETGAIQPIAEMGRLLKEINTSRQKKIYFHTDATQAIQYLDCQVDKLGVDLLSLSGHKFHAPKGVGVLFHRQGTPLVEQQDGGGQEFGLRAGTENVPYIVGLGKALDLLKGHQKELTSEVLRLRNELVNGILKIPGVSLVGDLQKNAPHIATFLIERAEGESLLLLLSEKGIAASSGSACTSGLLKPSHVLLAMGYPSEKAHGSLRFSLGVENTSQEVDYVLDSLPPIISQLRRMAPNGF